MTDLVRDGRFDVAVLAGPGVEIWPSAGVHALSTLCAEMGLDVGLFGGEALEVRGVVSAPGTGGIAIVQDVQNRVHRIHARAVVKVSPVSGLTDPFSGWYSPGFLPIVTAEKLWRRGRMGWGPATVIIGTGNRALRFGSALLEGGATGDEVFCIEPHAQWGAKRFAGWEVERRRFEMLGGRLLEAKPVSLQRRAAQLWELRVADAQGVRVLEVARVVSAGPFRGRDLPGGEGVREYPPGSSLFELVQSAQAVRTDDVEGWVIEEERGRWLAGKIVRALVTDLGPNRERLDRIFSRARGRLKRYFRHRESPFTPEYQGKWIAPADAAAIRNFSGAPRQKQRSKLVASIECYEEIPCSVCQDECPEDAISNLGKVPRPDGAILNESKCTACGICVQACPSSAVVLMSEREDRSSSELVLPWRGRRAWKLGDFATVLNRRGESLGNGRVLEVPGPGLVRVEVRTHLAWDARGVRPIRASAATDEAFVESFTSKPQAAGDERVEITFNGEKRLVERGMSVSTALFETGHSRAADLLQCHDGSCGLCTVTVDGLRKLACKTEVRRGMNVRLPNDGETSVATPPAAAVPASVSAPPPAPATLCPCLGVTAAQVIERLQQARLRSPEAVLSVLHVGEGKCHGRLCMDGFRRVLADQGLDVSQWIDWRFPWSEWMLAPTQGGGS